MRERVYQKIGWVLFLLCSFCYTADALAVRNPLAIMGGGLFFAGCLVFMWPLFIKKHEPE